MPPQAVAFSCDTGDRVLALYPGDVKGTPCTLHRDACWRNATVASVPHVGKHSRLLTASLGVLILDWDNGDPLFRAVAYPHAVSHSTLKACGAQVAPPQLIHQTAPSNQSTWHHIWTSARNSWQLLCPSSHNYQHLLWDDADLRSIIETFTPEYLSSYDSYEINIRRMDIARLVLLLIFGGFYVDMDMEAVGHSCPFPAQPVGVAAIAESPFQFNEKYQNSLIASSPGHPLWRHILREAMWRSAHRAPMGILDEPGGTLHLTGPKLIDHTVSSWLDSVAGGGRDSYWPVQSFPPDEFNVLPEKMWAWTQHKDPRSEHVKCIHYVTSSWMAGMAGGRWCLLAEAGAHLALEKFLIARPGEPNIAVRINAASCDDKKIIHVAVERGHEAVVRVLLRAGAHASVKDALGIEPVHYAADKGHTVILSMLVVAGAEATANIANGSLAAHHAVRKGLRDAVDDPRSLLNTGLSSFRSGELADRLQPLHLATSSGHAETMQWLLIARANPNVMGAGEQPLHIACAIRDEKLAALLLSHGANPEAKGKHGWNALVRAIANAHTRTMDLLVKHRASVTQATGEDGAQPLHWAVALGHKAISNYLLRKRASLHAVDKDHMAPVHHAVHRGHLKLLRFLVTRKADLEAKSLDDMSPLRMAQNNNHTDIAIFLEKYRKKPEL